MTRIITTVTVLDRAVTTVDFLAGECIRVEKRLQVS